METYKVKVISLWNGEQKTFRIFKTVYKAVEYMANYYNDLVARNYEITERAITWNDKDSYFCFLNKDLRECMVTINRIR